MNNKYKNILDEIEWSFSTIHQYDECPYSFYNKKIDASEINEGNFYSDAGGYSHEVLAMIFSGKLLIDDVITYYIDNYDNNIFYKTKQSTMDNKFNEFIDYLAILDLGKLTDYEILGVEKEYHWKIGKYKFIGFVDLIIRHKITKEIILIDHKSADHFLKKNGEVLKNQEENFKAYSHQMYMYCKPILEEFGQQVNTIVWNHFFENQLTVIPFVQADYDETQEWAKKTVQTIYKDNEFKENKSYMRCKILCGFRNSCEYNNEGGE